jgi:peptidoglycan/xylan/chitin deacetylase (PgdA/CDA1 family)
MIRHEHVRFFCTFALIAILLSGCARATSSVDLNTQMTQAVQTALVSIQQTQTAAISPATQTPVITPTAVRTPPALATTFTTSLLNGGGTPHTYVQDSCEYLKQKWSSTNSLPGTIAMVVMFHTISKDTATAANEISSQDFKKLMNDLHDAGFQAIYMQELADFLYSNAKIPERSVVLIQDDRHAAQNFTDHFLQYFQDWGWPVINGWISTPLNTADLWQQQETLAAQGWVDYQAHGVQHLPIDSSSSDTYILGELQGSVDAFQQHFHKTPIAFVWPGGGFTPHAVELARSTGYKLGFTVNPRGPLMYNWIPLADQQNPAQPLAIAEGPVNDPLMVLPRYWDTDARAHIDEVRQIGNAAAAYAESQKANELEYYDIICAPNYGPMP